MRLFLLAISNAINVYYLKIIPLYVMGVSVNQGSVENLD